MSKAFSLSQVVKGRGITADLGGYRNKIINGNFNVRQRGDAHIISPSSVAYTLDRWMVTNFTDQPVRITVGPLLPGQAQVPGNPEFFLAVIFDAAPTSGGVFISQPIEGVETLAGEKATVTVYAAQNNLGGDYQMYIEQGFGVGGSPAVTLPELTFRFEASDEFAKIQRVIDIPDIEGKIIGASNSINLTLYLEPRTAGEAYFSHISLVHGDASAEADPFSERHIQQEMALCQRYFRFLGTTILHRSASVPGQGISFQHLLSGEMRVNPSVAFTPSLGSGHAASSSRSLVQFSAYPAADGIVAFDSVSVDAEL